MSDIGSSLVAFARMSSEDRERSIRLITAYNDAVFETHPASSGETRPSQLFNWDEIEHLVKDYRADRLSNIGPAMQRYLSLLDRGYRWPNLG
jgi:hypothetical protein